VAEARQVRDDRSWYIGAWATRYCIDRPAGGRPAPEDYTVAKLAAALGELPSAVGEWRNNYHFWERLFESLPENASWRNCAQARRDSGWRPGAPIMREHQRHALDFLLEKTDSPYPPPDTRPPWARKLERAVAMLTAIADDPDMPELIRLSVRTFLEMAKKEKT
jgi:hypothetical protein